MKAFSLFLVSCTVLGSAACSLDRAEVATGDPGMPAQVGFFGGLAGGGTFGGGAFGPSGRPIRLEELRTAATSPPTISGGTLAVSTDGNSVVAADSDRNNVYVVDVSALSVKKLSLPPGSEPGRVVLDSSGGAHVALRGSGKLARVDVQGGSLSGETDLCTQPRGLAYDAKHNAVVATCMDGQVVSLDAVSHEEISRETLAQDLRDVVVDGSGRRWFSRYRSAELLTSQSDGSLTTSRPRPAKARHSPSFIFSGTSGSIVGGGTGVIVGGGTGAGSTNPVPSPADGLVNMSPALAWRALPSKSGGVWMLHQQSQDDQVVVTQGGYGSGCQTITAGAITLFSAAGEASGTIGVNLEGLSVDAAFSPDDKRVAIASPGAFARSGSTLQIYSAESLPLDTNPDQCPSPTAQAGSESQVTAVAFDGSGLLYALSREPAELQIYQLDTLAQTEDAGVAGLQALTRISTIALDRSSARDTGHDLFHADVGQGLACASCHGEALDDGHVWNFSAIGARRTQNIRGGFLRTAPFHWNGDMENMGHLVDDVMTGRMGGFKVEASFAAALGQWIDRQPALSLPARDSAAAARGKLLFESSETQCSRCHSGPNFTNNESDDVGTGGTFQVPGLLGLAQRPPYMHTGCAKTLADRFDEACGGTDHGKTAQLSAAQRADLSAYLSSL